MKFQKNVVILLFFVSGLLLFDFLWWHWRLGMTRYFDVDELAYLHWAYNVFSGKRPYVDFFFYIPPGFLWFLAPLFSFGQGIVPIIAARLAQCVIFVALVGITIALFWEMRKSCMAVLAGLVLAFLPLPFDKFLEVRPDTLATLLVMLGLLLQIKFKAKLLFYAGLCYALSLLVLPKSAPQVVLALVVAIGAPIGGLTLGFALPLVLFGLWLFSLGNFSLVWYSLMKLPFEVSRIGEVFVMRPDLFFYPNQIFYGEAGWSAGLLANHALWLIGLSVGAYRLLTPYLPSGKSGAAREFLVAGSFFVHVFSYVLLFPMRHSQYLIPIAVFVSFYAADGAYLFWQKAKAVNKKTVAFLLTALLAMGALGLVWLVFERVNTPKLSWTNKEDFAVMEKIWTTVPKGAYVLDLDGRTLYFRDSFYVCCLPFGQYVPYLSRPLPPLTQALERTQTQYVYEGQLGRIESLRQEDRSYIKTNFQPVPAVSGLLHWIK